MNSTLAAFLDDFGFNCENTLKHDPQQFSRWWIRENNRHRPAIIREWQRQESPTQGVLFEAVQLLTNMDAANLIPFKETKRRDIAEKRIARQCREFYKRRKDEITAAWEQRHPIGE